MIWKKVKDPKGFLQEAATLTYEINDMFIMKIEIAHRTTKGAKAVYLINVSSGLKQLILKVTVDPTNTSTSDKITVDMEENSDSDSQYVSKAGFKFCRRGYFGNEHLFKLA